MAVYNNDSILEEYMVSRTIPNIHKDIVLFAVSELSKPSGIIDLGSSFGVLTNVISKEMDCFCLGLEANFNLYSKSPKFEHVDFENLTINQGSLPALKLLIRLNKIDTILARRVFPELSKNDTKTFSMLESLSDLFFESGITQILLEGRISVKNPTTKYYNVQQECDAFFKNYKIKKNKNNIVLLERL